MESAGVVDLIQKAWKVGGDVLESFRYVISANQSWFAAARYNPFGWTEGGGHRGAVSIVQLTLTSFACGVVARRP